MLKPNMPTNMPIGLKINCCINNIYKKNKYNNY